MRSSALNSQRYDAPRQGADIYKIHVQTRQVVRLTTQVWTPPTGATKWSANHLSSTSSGSYYLGYGIFNLAPCPLPGGKLMFVSSRDGFLPNKGYTFPNLRLYIMDEDGSNAEQIGHLNIGSALHPTVLTDGRVMFSSYEAQGLRDQRNWGLWAIWPDGRQWEPLMSAFTYAAAFHFQTQLSDGRIAVVEYYNLNNNGFGTLLAFDSRKNPSAPPFGSANPGSSSNPSVRRGLWYFQPGHPSHLQPRYKRYPFSPPGLVNLTGFTHGQDEASSRALDGSLAGKVTHPAGAPGNDVLVSYSPGPANNLNRPTSVPYYDGGIYILRGGVASNDHRQLVMIKNDSRYNEMMPRALVSYAAIYGIEEPATLPYLPNDGAESPMLPAGSPFGLVGTSTFYKRDSAPGVYSSSQPSWNFLDVFNTSENDANSNWFEQGADAGKYSNSDIHAVRIVALEGVAHRSYGPGIGNGNVTGFSNHASDERLRILGEIPLRKPGAVDPDGNPDTSFLARIPADTPFKFQTLDKDGLVLNMAQTWHQVRPGEQRADCGGCHAHSQVGTDFNLTAAGRGAAPLVDLIDRVQLLTKDASVNTTTRELNQSAFDVEYYRDIKPILQRSCAQCHSNGTAAAGLVLDDITIAGGYENTYNRLANDSGAKFGIPPIISNKTWRQSNTSRYIRAFQSRRSLLMWKIMGRRLDGWTNADHPTESVPGDPSTLPAGANPNLADLDYTGEIMPPPGSGIPPLSDDEKMLFARWIDLGCPITTQDATLKVNLGWFVDDLRPVLTVSMPAGRTHTGPLATLRFGAYDAYSGLDRPSISVTASFPVNGRPPETELAADFRETSPYVWALDLTQPVPSLSGARLTVKVKDRQGNWSVVERVFEVISGAAPPAPPNPPAPPAPKPPSQYSIPDRGGTSWMTSSASDPLTIAHGRVEPDADSTTPSGVAIFGLRINGVLVTEAGVPASSRVQSGRIQFEIEGPVNTGIAIANSSDQAAEVAFSFTDAGGDLLRNGTFTMGANHQVAAFLNEAPFLGPSAARGTFTFTASSPVAVTALRGLRNERNEFLISTLPISPAGSSLPGGTVVLSHFGSGAGWTTTIVLTNTTDVEQTGTLQFFGPGSAGGSAPLLTTTVDGTTASTFSYVLPPRGSRRLITGNMGTSVQTGSIRLIPSAGSGAPSAVAIFSFRRDGITVTEASVSAAPMAPAFRVYVESSGTANAIGSIRSGVALANTSPTAVDVNLALNELDGSPYLQPVSLTVPAGGQIAKFINEVFPAMSTGFQGILRVTSNAPVAVAGLRGRYNERGDFLIATTPPWNESGVGSNSVVVYPHIVSGGGYTTQLILFGQQGSGKFLLMTRDGQTLSSANLSELSVQSDEIP